MYTAKYSLWVFLRGLDMRVCIPGKYQPVQGYLIPLPSVCAADGQTQVVHHCRPVSVGRYSQADVLPAPLSFWGKLLVSIWGESQL